MQDRLQLIRPTAIPCYAIKIRTRMHTLIQMKSVDPADPFGRKDRHRTCRILIQRGEDLRALCWFRLGLDQSIYFGVPGVTAGVLGKAAFQADSRLTPVAPERSLSDLPSAAC